MLFNIRYNRIVSGNQARWQSTSLFWTCWTRWILWEKQSKSGL